ncbi:hypothetical protein DFH27DRAFT_529309 [Peziza echinospora]|nr:hypothetical protein DFH27DRAFT_529309 [Peziza echinospora]
MLAQILSQAKLHPSFGDEVVFYGKQQIVGSLVDNLVAIAPNDDILDKTGHELGKTVTLEKQGRPTKLLGMEVHWDELGSRLVTPENVPPKIGKSPGYNPYNSTRCSSTSKPLRTTNELTISSPTGNSQAHKSVGTCNPERRTDIAKNGKNGRPIGSEDSCRRIVRRRGLQVTNGHTDDNQPPTDYLVIQETGHGIIIHNGSRVRSSMRWSEGCKLDQATTAALQLSKNHAYYRRSRHIQYKYHYLRQETKNREIGSQRDTGEGEPVRFNNLGTAGGSHNNMKSELCSIPILKGLSWLDDMIEMGWTNEKLQMFE